MDEAQGKKKKAQEPAQAQEPIQEIVTKEKDNEKEQIMAEKQTPQNSSIIYYGNSAEVTNVDNFDYNDLSKMTKREQELPGFDKQYRDFVDYIMKITHDIWESKGIGVIYDTYHNNVTMHAGSVNIVGIREVIAGTLQTLHAFPDRRLIGQNVIWSPMDGGGFLSSHRVISTATNLGDSSFGPATGRKVNFRTTIDCAAENNRIYEEWLVRDNLWLVMQLGLDPDVVAKNMAAKSVSTGYQKNFGLNEAMEGQFMPEEYAAKDDSVGERMLEMASRVYNSKRMNEVPNYYHPNAVVHHVCNKDLNGYDEIQGMMVSMLSSIPNGSYEVERVTCNAAAGKDEYDVALRWRLRGLNEGIGFFGAPSGKQLDVLGISHFHLRQGKIVEEWVTFDGLDVLRQKYLGDAAEADAE